MLKKAFVSKGGASHLEESRQLVLHLRWQQRVRFCWAMPPRYQLVPMLPETRPSAKQNIPGFEVAVDKASGVDMLQSFQRGTQDVADSRLAKLDAKAQTLPEVKIEPVENHAETWFRVGWIDKHIDVKETH